MTTLAALRWRYAADQVRRRLDDFRWLLRKYSEDQPRAPAGTPDGGQWVSADGGVQTFLDMIAEGLADSEPVQLASDITGFTRHGLNRLIERGVSPIDILDAMRSPISVVSRPDGSTQYRGKNATIVLNPDGKVITGWSK